MDVPQPPIPFLDMRFEQIDRVSGIEVPPLPFLQLLRYELLLSALCYGRIDLSSETLVKFTAPNNITRLYEGCAGADVLECLLNAFLRRPERMTDIELFVP